MVAMADGGVAVGDAGDVGDGVDGDSDRKV
jgi:hypothetical protein